MKIMLDDCSLVNVFKGEYEGNTYYQAWFLDNGYTIKLACSQAFYETFKSQLKDKDVVHLKSGLKAEYREFGDKKRIKLV